ncbi:Epha3 [Phodopus roborovskii]|uniref:Epha3 protein n=1 Tax=Phodopus roborovskii TaxID=109678 RepID=A0AAU9ZK66_PHORO|nr:Epha3 [Phodopus roborovskii]
MDCHLSILVLLGCCVLSCSGELSPQPSNEGKPGTVYCPSNGHPWLYLLRIIDCLVATRYNFNFLLMILNM